MAYIIRVYKLYKNISRKLIIISAAFLLLRSTCVTHIKIYYSPPLATKIDGGGLSV